jgi:acetyl-CoA acetyltransferase
MTPVFAVDACRTPVGARITTTLLHEFRRRGGRRAAATMCIGVGQGIATLWESP